MKPEPAYELCPECGQPMLPPGEVKRPNEYDHARGCPLDPRRKKAPTKYIDVCCGEMRISLGQDGVVSISGGSKDPDKQRYQAIDGLRVKIGRLNEQIADCIMATDALARQKERSR